MKIKIFLFLIAVLFLSLMITPDVILAQEWCHTFNVNLRKGDQSEEVSELQRALIKEGFLFIPRPTGYFWTMTVKAVIAFQEKYASEILAPWGLTRGNGLVSFKTREKLNQLYGCSTISTCTPSWQCADWNTCSNNQQTRTCADS